MGVNIILNVFCIIIFIFSVALFFIHSVKKATFYSRSVRGYALNMVIDKFNITAILTIGGCIQFFESLVFQPIF